MSDEQHPGPCDDDGLETDGAPRDDEPTEPDISQADFGDPQRED